MGTQFISIPLFLTWVRLIGSITVLPVLILFFVPMEDVRIRALSTIIFFLLAITDFFDGHFARRYKQSSAFGEFLDPIADKFLLFVSLICLLSILRIHILFVLILMLRELYIMSLRQYAGEMKSSLAVSYGGKLKTVLLTIAIVLACAQGGNSNLSLLKDIFFILGTFVSLASALLYTINFLNRSHR